MTTSRLMNRAALVAAACVFAACVLAGAARAADDIRVRGIIFESAQGMLMETEEGDVLHLVGMGLEDYAESVAVVTGAITVTDGGDEVFVVTSVRPDDEAEPGGAGRDNLQ
jgi:hypothetical protein